MATFIKNNAVIVVGVDYSQNSNDALEAACGLARTLADAAVHLVHVTTPSGAAFAAGMTQLLHSFANPAPLDELQAEKRVEALTQRTVGPSRRAAHLFGHLRTGNAAREIVQLASDLSADLIVVGTHGETGVMRLLLGSVAQNVVTHAPCPVLVVKPEGLPRWPAIEPPCPDCVAVQKSSHGQRLWCQRHSEHHASAHTYSEYSEGYGLGAQTFRGYSSRTRARGSGRRRAPAASEGLSRARALGTAGSSRNATTVLKIRWAAHCGDSVHSRRIA
jgi:nucleotide-binding universal stress UspA family protein